MRSKRGLWTLLCALGCSQQFADPIGLADAPKDPCAAWTSEAECRADSRNACSVQPNAVGCTSRDAKCPPSACATGDPFVRRTGATLRLKNQPYRFVGTNSWGVAWGPDCKIEEYSEGEAAATRVFDDLAELGVGVLRVWAFQSYAGGSGSDYANFERLVSHARRAGVRLVFVLENQYPDCSRGVRDEAWFKSGYASPYGGYALSYTAYVERLVQHFKDEPALLAWELMHEGGADDFASLNSFVDQLSALIRVHDPNHLIAIGVNNGYSRATNNQGADSNYEKLHAHSTVDLIDVHDFTNSDQPLNDDELTDRSLANALGKPIFIGALAAELDDSSSDALSLRANRIQSKLDAAYEQGFVGALIYDYYPDWQHAGYSFDSRPSDPLGGANGVLARTAARLRSR